MEMEEGYNIFDLLHDVWEPYSETYNLELMIDFLSKYTKNQSNNHRIHEARKMTRVITELKSLWSQNGPVKTVYKKDLYGCIKIISTTSLKSELSDDFLSKESFNEWLHDYKKYLKDTVTNNELNMPTMSKTIDHGTAFHCQNNETCSSLVPQVDFQPATVGPNITNNETKTKEKEKDVFNAMFNSIFQKDEANVRIPQYIKISDKKQLCIISSPGEIGSEVVRLAVFDVKEITKPRVQDWWQSAKLRLQFLIYPSSTDYKQQLLSELYCHFLKELSTISGVKKESKSNELNIPTMSKTIDHGTVFHCQNNETCSSSVSQMDFQPATAGPNITNNETETKEKEKGTFNAMFNSFFQKDEANVRIPQYIKISDKKQLCIISSPGEIGSDCEVVRLAVFDVKEVTKPRVQDWWQSAKQRFQFLISTSSITDYKQQLLSKLYCHFLKELSTIPGVKSESKSNNHEAGTSNS